MSALDEAFKPKPRTPSPFTPAAAPAGQGYGAAALAGEVANLLAVPIGAGRNHALNVAAFKLGRIIAAGDLDEQTVVETLGAADGGLDYKETRDTIASGIAAGKLDPRVRADRPDADERITEWLGSSVTPSPSSPASTTPTTVTDGLPSTSPSVSSSPSTTTDPAPPDDTAGAEVREHLPLIDWHELWQDDTSEDWIIEPLLPARRLIAIYSAPKVGKSLLMLEIAVGVSRGVRTLGADLDRPRRVLYVDYENDPAGDVRARLQNMGVGPDDLDNLCYLSFPTMATLDTEQGARQLMAAVDEYGCEVVVIDTVSRSVAGDENENDTWLAFYRQTGLRMKQAGVAMIRLDHSGKDDTKGQRGGSAKSGDVDAVWRMSRVTDDTFRLACEANRFMIPAGDKLLTLTRIDTPLHHVVEPFGARAAILESIITHLDVAAVPHAGHGSGVRAVHPGIKAAGITASRQNVLDALALRRRRAGLEETDTPDND